PPAPANWASDAKIWSQTSLYDRYGNMWCDPNSTTGTCDKTIAFAAGTTTNRIITSAYTYDAAGNLTQDGTGMGTHTYQWDAEGRLVSVDGVAGQACQTTWTACYTYNALGQHAGTQTGTTYNEFVYDPSGVELGRQDRGSSFLWQYLMLGARPF